ncbi:MAG: DUF1572 domain-containing protein [Ignavibacteriae bacterium]|nr:MAG: DUF1572 domain-containing protein [Ignavibacteriota bacterium]
MKKVKNKLILLYKDLFIRYLDQLREEIDAIKTEEGIWDKRGSINNAPGTLCVHICGNLQHFIGATIGQTGYIRQREHEFEVKNVPREDLLSQIEITRTIVDTEFDNLNDDVLDDIFPSSQFGENITYSYALSRLISHFAYHVGQINYYRRAFTNNQ